MDSAALNPAARPDDLPIARAGETLLVFGGSFDPPHIAHVQQPMRVREAIDADAVLYIPAAQAPHKRHLRQTPAEHRLAMLRRATQDVDRARLSTIELQRAGDGRPSYTVDTLRTLRQSLPDDVTLRLLIGSDQVAIFGQWYCHDEVEQLAEPVVMLRPPTTRQQLLADLPDDAARHRWSRRLTPVDPMPISSTQIREAIAAGEADRVARWLHPAVLAYIEAHGLYVDQG